MSFAIDDFVALQNGGLPDSLSQMTLARAARTEEQSVLALADEAAGSQIEDQTAIHFRIGVSKSGLFAPALEQPIGTARECVRYQA